MLQIRIGCVYQMDGNSSTIRAEELKRIIRII